MNSHPLHLVATLTAAVTALSLAACSHGLDKAPRPDRQTDPVADLQTAPRPVLKAMTHPDSGSNSGPAESPSPSAGPSLVRTPVDEAMFGQLLPGANVSFVYGGVGLGVPTAQVARLDAGVSFARHIHTGDYHAVVIEGNFQHWEDGEPDQGPVMMAGSTFFQAGGVPHYDACRGPETCVVYVYFPVSADFEFVPAE